ncbi:MAG: oligosaccharide flippase family protein [Gammaproteobacteria bacterium]
MSVRRAFVWASAGRYLTMAINLVATLILARLLTPQEYGVTVVGGAVFTVAEALRALGGGAYLIQKQDLTQDDIRACFTVSFLATVLITALLLLLAEPLARFFSMPQLAPYVRVVALGYMAGPFTYPIGAMLSRRMAFGRIAAVGVSASVVYAGVSVALAVRGFSYMSFAWASAASTITSMLCYVILWQERSIFRPSFRRWGAVLNFGIYDSATALIAGVADSLPYFIFGKLFTPDAVGLAQRAVMLCMMPERVILAGVSAVALPAFAKEAREGRSVRGSYLRAIELLTAAQWPSLILLALLAHPLVAILLGSQWPAAAPLVQIFAVALMFAFPIVLHYAMVVSVGAIRYMPVIMVLQGICSIGALTLAARHGLYVAALSTLVILPCNGIIAVGIARHFLKFRWMDLFAASRKSLVVTVLCALGPALILFAHGDPQLGFPATVLAAATAALGWLSGLRLTRHPLLDEILRFAGAVRFRLKSGTWRQASP